MEAFWSSIQPTAELTDTSNSILANQKAVSYSLKTLWDLSCAVVSLWRTIDLNAARRSNIVDAFDFLVLVIFRHRQGRKAGGCHNDS